MIAEILVLFGVLLILLALGVPVFMSMAFSCAVYTVAFWPKVPLMVIGQSFIHSLDSYSFAAIIFFFFAGEVMSEGGIGARLVRFISACFGHIRGGLGHVDVFSNLLFSGVSGSALADVSAVGSMLIPQMKRAGYPGEYAAALTAAGATIGPMFPPSIAMVVYGLIAMVSIGKLFLAGIIPGLLMGLFLLVTSYVISLRRGYPAGLWAGWGEIVRSGASAGVALLMPVIIVVGLVGGVTTVTEVGAIAAAYAIFVSVFVYRELDLRGLWRVACNVGVNAAKILIMVAVAGLFIWIVGNMGAARVLASSISSMTTDPILVMSLIALALLMLGFILEPPILLVVFMPMLIPTANAVGIDLVQLGVVAIIAINLGLLTPPVGMLIYITAVQADVPARRVVAELWIFIAALLLLLCALVFFPSLTLWLPRYLIP